MQAASFDAEPGVARLPGGSPPPPVPHCRASLANGPSPNSEVPHRPRRAKHPLLSRKRVRERVTHLWDYNSELGLAALWSQHFYCIAALEGSAVQCLAGEAGFRIPDGIAREAAGSGTGVGVTARKVYVREKVPVELSTTTLGVYDNSHLSVTVSVGIGREND